MKNLTMVSYGGGQDSTAILIKLIKDKAFQDRYVDGDLIVVMAETGNEHDHTYRYVEYMKEVLYNADIPFYHLSQDEAPSSWKRGLIGFYDEKKAVGSKAFPKTCTDNLKIKPIYNFLERYVHNKYSTEKYGRKSALYEFARKYGKIKVLIGIAKGEEKRASANGTSPAKWFNECIDKHYPLIDEGMDRQACQDYIKDSGYSVPFPSNCILCPFMSDQELVYLYRYDRFWFDEWVRIEKNKINNNLHMGDRNLGVWGKTELLPQVLEKAMLKFGHMTKEELTDYKMSHGHCVKSKY